MAEASTIKFGEISKKISVTNKEIIAKLEEYGISVKGTASLISAENASFILDFFSKQYATTQQELEQIKEQELAQKAKEESNKPKVEEKRAEEKPQEEKKAPEKIEVKKATEIKDQKAKESAKPQPQKQPQKPAADKKKDKKQYQNQAKKQGGQRVDLSNVDRSNSSDEYIVKTTERRRYVDTRQSTVEIEKINERERIEDYVPSNIRINDRNKNKHNKKGPRPEEKIKNQPVKQKKVIPAKVITEIEIGETITVGEFASKMGKTGAEVIMKLMKNGIMATMNQAIDFETAELIGLEFDITVKQEVIITKEERLMMEVEEEDKAEDLVERPPVVVVMGHVDHGKTSLLDAIRDTSVTDTEAGGITQHIGAYSVTLNGRDITFLDTPGHEAFTTMRARGAQVTDVAIIVVAADDGIMPQTIEAINHAKAANVQIIVAINKIDREGANPDRVRQMLVEHELVPEEWGGDTICVEVSAKKRQNIDGLLEMVLLVADMQELKANPNRSASGTVIEAQIDKGRGAVATVLVQNGTLNVGDFVIAGTSVGRIRAMVNDKGRRVKSAPPSTPVEILGLGDVPSGGDTFIVVENEKLARDVAEQRKQELQENKFNQVVKVSLDNLFSQIDEGNMKELAVIIKADVQGSVEAVKQSLEKLSNEEVRVRAIHGGVGAINETDVMLANASNAIIVGFNVRPDAGALSAATQHEVDIRLYRVIYQAIEEMEAAMKGMLDPEFKENVLGYVEVRQTFKVPGVGTIAGCYVTQGKIQRNAEIRLVRDGIIIHEGKISSLKRFKDDAKEVGENFECGIGIEDFNDIKEGDTMECFIMEEVKR